MPALAQRLPAGPSQPDASPNANSTPESEGANRPARPERWKNCAGYAAVVGATLLLTATALQLWRADLRVPLFGDSDNLMAQMLVQNVLETGWFLDNDRLGASGAINLRDYPLADVLHFAAFKLLGCVTHDSGVVLNLYELLGFPLASLSAYFVLRRFRLGRLAALVPAVLFACAPYHFLRIRGHPFLASYYLLPPMIWIILRVYLGRSPFLRAESLGGRPRWRLLSGEAAGAALLCVLTGLAGVYYAFFSCFLLLMAAVKSAFRERRWTPLAAASVLVLLVAASVATALLPSFLQMARYGRNPAVADRAPAEADVYGLHIGEMLLPVPQHRIKFLAELRQKFMAPPRQQVEGAPFAALGILGSLGFCCIAGRFLWRHCDKVERIEDGLAYLNGAAVLLGTVGGVGSMFAFYVTPTIRCYDRLSIFIAFFGLAGLFLALQRVVGRYASGCWRSAAYAAALVGLLIVGWLDQTSKADIPFYTAIKAQYASDADFGRRMEAALPPGSMVFQMPYVPFPENPPIQYMADYELFRPFLHTRTLRWSYGAVKGREASQWQADVAARPTAEAAEQLACAGFRGIYLDRAGFADQGAATEADLSRLLGAAPMVSLNGRQAFFDLTAYGQALRGRYSDQEWQTKCEAVRHPLRLTWGGAFGGLEPDPGGGWRWCGARGELQIANPLDRPRRAVMKMTCLGWNAAPARLVVDGDLCRRELSVTPDGQVLDLDLIVPPGNHVLSFVCNGPSVPAPGDPRELVFRVSHFQWREE
jgi:phosphoglycerol transferase